MALVALLFARGFTSSARAQTSLTSSSGAPTLPSPTEAHYDGTGAIGPSGSWLVAVACDNGGSNCTLQLTLSPTVFDLQWQFVSAPTPAADCSTSFSAGTFRDVTGGTILTITKNRSCSVTLRFQAKPLTAPGSWSTYTSPNTYVQPVTLTLTKP